MSSIEYVPVAHIYINEFVIIDSVNDLMPVRYPNQA